MKRPYLVLFLLSTASLFVAPAYAQSESRRPGAVFRDCPNCPEMVVVPPGTFTMGSPDTEKDASDHEGPQRRVTIAMPFALGKYEVMFDEYDSCAREGGCDHRPNDQSWGRSRQPAINISWNDAKAYVAWLSRKTGKLYRLPSEAEWEYAARAGTSTRYSWGDEFGRNRANCHGCGSQWDGRQTAPVGSFAANGFGLHDMHGNAREWVEDCWHESYVGAPADGSAWIAGGDCSVRVLRGGSWNLNPTLMRGANRNRTVPGSRINFFGFRVARTI